MRVEDPPLLDQLLFLPSKSFEVCRRTSLSSKMTSVVTIPAATLDNLKDEYSRVQEGLRAVESKIRKLPVGETAKRPKPTISSIVHRTSSQTRLSSDSSSKKRRGSEDPDDESEESEDEDTDADFFYDSPNNVRNWSALSKQETTRESREFKEFVQKIPRLNAVASNPFVSPLLFEDFSVLGSIDLHLISSHFDESLDDNVSLARVWTGKVHLDVIEDNLFDLTVEGFIAKPLSASQGHSIVVKTINES